MVWRCVQEAETKKMLKISETGRLEGREDFN